MSDCSIDKTPLAIVGKMKTAVGLLLDINQEWIVLNREKMAAAAENSFDIIIRWDNVDHVLTWEQVVELALKDGVKTDVFGKGV